MRGVYTSQLDIAGLASSKTLMLLQAPASKAVELLSCWISGTDATSTQMLVLGVYNVTTIGSPTGTAVTPEKHESGDTASTVTATGNLTVEPTAYSAVAIDKAGVPSVGGYRYDPTPEERPYIAPSGALGVRLLNTPTSFDCTVGIVYREIG